MWLRTSCPSRFTPRERPQQTHCTQSSVGSTLTIIWDKVIYKNQLDATITIYWSPRSDQHVSGNLLPIIRSVRLRFTAYGIVSCCGRQGFGKRQRGTCSVWRMLKNILRTEHVVPRCRSPNTCLPQQQDTIPYAVNLSLTLLMMGKRLPETC